MKIKDYWLIFKEILSEIFTPERTLKAIPALIFSYTTFKIFDHCVNIVKKSSSSMFFLIDMALSYLFFASY
ncbi:UNVERIFIED_ORG: hypothetical protein ABIC58_001985 [Leuconostoc holzapfelii]